MIEIQLVVNKRRVSMMEDIFEKFILLLVLFFRGWLLRNIKEKRTSKECKF